MKIHIKILAVFLGGLSLSAFLVMLILVKSNQNISAPAEDYFKWLVPVSFEIYEGGQGQNQQVTSVDRLEDQVLVKGAVSQKGQITYDYESQLNFDKNKVVQKVVSGAPVDGILEEMVVLKGPIQVGTQWSFKGRLYDDQDLYIIGKITTLTEDELIIFFTNKDGSYEEERTYKSHRGLQEIKTRYEVLGAEQENNYVAVSGQEKPKDHKSSQVLYQGVPFEENWVYNNKTRIIDQGHLEKYEALYEWFLDYQGLWIDYINKEDQSLFDKVTLGSPVYETLYNFDKKEIKEQFDEITILWVKEAQDHYAIATEETIIVYQEERFKTEYYNQIYLIKKEQPFMLKAIESHN